MRKGFIDVSGKDFGAWHVLAPIKTSRGSKKFTCRCRCGHVCAVRSVSLRKGTSTCCSVCAHIKKRRPAYAAFWNRLVAAAKHRGIDLTVTREQIMTLLKQQDYKCALTDLPIAVATSRKAQAHGEGTASLDRKDSTRGYHFDNVQWVHKDVNKAKLDFTQQRFIELCKLVTEKNNQVSNGTEVH